MLRVCTISLIDLMSQPYIIEATNTISSGEFNQQIDEAIRKIKAIEEITLQQKEFLITIMNEAKSSTKESEKQLCRGKFEAFMHGAGSASLKVISALSGLSSIARFFGLGV